MFPGLVVGRVCVCVVGQVLWVWVGMGVVWAGRSVGPHNLALEVVDDQREVEVEYMAALGHQQLQGEDVTFMLQELLRHVLGGRRESTRMDRGQTVSRPS